MAAWALAQANGVIWLVAANIASCGGGKLTALVSRNDGALSNKAVQPDNYNVFNMASRWRRVNKQWRHVAAVLKHRIMK